MCFPSKQFLQHFTVRVFETENCVRPNRTAIYIQPKGICCVDQLHHIYLQRALYPMLYMVSIFEIENFFEHVRPNQTAIYIQSIFRSIDQIITLFHSRYHQLAEGNRFLIIYIIHPHIHNPFRHGLIHGEIKAQRPPTKLSNITLLEQQSPFF